MAQANGSAARGCGWLAAIGVALFAIAKCAGLSRTDPTATPTAAVSTPGVVAARSLRCRTEPNATSRVQATLRRNAPVTITEHDGSWSRLDRPDGGCWVATAFLTDGPPGDGDRRGAAIETKSLPGNNHAGSTRTAASTAQGPAAVGAGTVATTHRDRHRATTHRTRSGLRSTHHSYTPRSRGYFYDDGACPCSGSHICIGPRGGRYCITSGGNKRYGV